MINIDLNDFSGGPNWLSLAGKGGRAGIRAKHRAAYEAAHPRKRNPVRPETMARLEAAIAQAMQASFGAADEAAYWNKHREKHRQPLVSPAPYEPSEIDHMHAWSKAIMLLDSSEVLTRDLIERELVDIAGNAMSFYALDKTVKHLMRKIKPVREEAIKLAFRVARSRLGNRPIMGQSLDVWAREFVKSDLEGINTAIRVGLVNGLDNVEIARKVVGSMAMNGIDGVTEYTRHKIGHLGRAAIRETLNK